MTRFREHNQAVIGAVTIAVIVVLVAGALNFSKLPLISSNATYKAYFADAGSLVVGDIVTVAGVKEGQISSITLSGNHVLVTFTVRSSLHLGLETGATAQVLTPIGQEYLELTPAGPGHLSAATVIPVSRTSIPSTLVGDLNTFGSETEHYNITQLAKALEAAGQTLGAVPAATTAKALSGLARFSSILADRQSELAVLVRQGSKLTAVLNARSGELVDLVGQGGLVLKVLSQRRQAIKALLTTTSALSKQLSAILVGDHSEIGTLLSSLKTVSAVLSRTSTKLADAIPVLAAFDRYAANASGSGPFVDTVIPTTLIPDNLVKQCHDEGALNTTLGCRA
jgi:phospholipid/cholesterol/gamma-HCH transport system substrate-binding protein